VTFFLSLLLLFTSDFERGVEAYKAQRFDEALALFEAALADSEVAKGPVLHNLGNCAYRLGRFPEAIGYYARASLRMPFDPEPRACLNLARRELGLEPIPPTAGESFARFDRLPNATRLWLVGTLQLLALSGVVLLRRRPARLTMFGVLCVSLVGAARLVRTHFASPSPEGVIVADEVSLRREPHTNLGILLELKAGEIVRVEECSDRWARIVHPQGSGWIDRFGLALID